jgi:hypothetical protein
MTSKKKNIIFDIAGTLVSYEAMFDALDMRLVVVCEQRESSPNFLTR